MTGHGGYIFSEFSMLGIAGNIARYKKPRKSGLNLLVGSDVSGFPFDFGVD